MIGLSRPLYACIFRFVLVSLLTVVLLTGTTFLIALMIAYFQDDSWYRPAYLMTGLCCGLISWLFIAIFHLRQESQCLPIAQPEQFLLESKIILQEMGYTVSEQPSEVLTFRPRFHAFLFGGSIQITLEGENARLTGPKVSLEIFRRRVRLRHHVQRVQQVLHEQRKTTDHLLKRVELRLRLQPHQLESVCKNVIDVLKQEGTVICDLNLLAHSQKGIHENLVDIQIHQWLEQEGIEAGIHKNYVQFIETIPSGQELVTASA